MAIDTTTKTAKAVLDLSVKDGATRPLDKIGDAAESAGKKLEKAAGGGDLLGKKFEELAKGMVGLELHDMFGKLNKAAGEASDGMLDLQGAFVGLQVAGPAGAAIGLLHGAISKLPGAFDFAIDAAERMRDEIGKANQWWHDEAAGILRVNAAFAEQARVLADVNYVLATNTALRKANAALGIYARGPGAGLAGSLGTYGQNAFNAGGVNFGAGAAYVEQVRQASADAAKAWSEELKKLAGDQARIATDDLVARLERGNGTAATRQTIGGFPVGRGFRGLADGSGAVLGGGEQSYGLGALDYTSGRGLTGNLKEIGGAGAGVATPQQTWVERTFGPNDQFAPFENAFGNFTASMRTHYAALVSGSESVGKAFKRAIGDSMLAVGSDLLAQGIKNQAYALGYGAAALFTGNWAPVAAYEAAAVADFAGAAAIGVIANKLGAGGGGSASSSKGSVGGGGSRAGAPNVGFSGYQGPGGGNATTIILQDSGGEDSARMRDAKLKAQLARINGTSWARSR